MILSQKIFWCIYLLNILQCFFLCIYIQKYILLENPTSISLDEQWKGCWGNRLQKCIYIMYIAISFTVWIMEKVKYLCSNTHLFLHSDVHFLVLYCPYFLRSKVPWLHSNVLWLHSNVHRHNCYNVHCICEQLEIYGEFKLFRHKLIWT